MTDSTRRDFLKYLAAAPLAEFAVTAVDLERVSELTRKTLEELAQRGEQYRPKYFSPDDWRTVRILVDLVIPRDEQSGSATDAGVPEFMDFTLGDRPNMRTWMRSGLAWLDAECVGRFGKPFRECERAQQTAMLDDIAWPRRARPEMQAGVRFFNNFRNFTASGFWSSKMGVEDLQYMGNRPSATWNGCPAPALNKLGVRYS
ncbi:MAG TPA: gluconate 2-dehydrogenase subunit 3 family protein [Gemmatimonadaceae bacterium]|nr:gluconate 2-dehydrogenase subunit 3 family protein [Gemmatimonadaceae bacterium]